MGMQIEPALLKPKSFEEAYHNFEKSGACPPMMCRDFSVVDNEIRALDNATRSFEMVASTELRDAHGSTIMQKGWVLNQYRKNPVVLVFHDYRSLPVAVSLKTEVRPDTKLWFTPSFAPEDIYQFADTVYKLMLANFMRMSSVSFRVLKYETDKEAPPNSWEPYRILKQELVEISVLPVGSNPGAMKPRELMLDTMTRALEADVINEQEVIDLQGRLGMKEGLAGVRYVDSHSRIFIPSKPEGLSISSVESLREKGFEFEIEEVEEDLEYANKLVKEMRKITSEIVKPSEKAASEMERLGIETTTDEPQVVEKSEGDITLSDVVERLNEVVQSVSVTVKAVEELTRVVLNPDMATVIERIEDMETSIEALRIVHSSEDEDIKPDVETEERSGNEAEKGKELPVDTRSKQERLLELLKGDRQTLLTEFKAAAGDALCDLLGAGSKEVNNEKFRNDHPRRRHRRRRPCRFLGGDDGRPTGRARYRGALQDPPAALP